MGRTSKFTFPLPGKKPKPGIGPIVSGPMSKAQKILGTAELNIDAPKQWDDMSNSGISISVSESTATTSYHTNDRALQTVGEEEEYGGNGRSNTRWELESETVPAYLRSGRNSRMPEGDGTIRDMMSETSSLRRRQSNSTLRSWYDKAKMPLSISQQTSASAMAKGLPSKASALLDVDSNGSSPSAATLKSRRPSRLDLSHLIPGRHRRESQLAEASPRSMLGHDYVTRSPSTASISPATPPADQQRNNNRLVKKPTKERLAEIAAAQQRPRTGSSSQQSAYGQALNSPRDLYDHYEQASFRQFMESPEGEEEKMEIPDFPPAPVGPTPLRSPSYPRNSVANPVIREPQAAGHEKQSSDANVAGQCPRAFSSGPPPSASDNDYASSFASVSSRHTKTSKASKHTNQSLPDSDRQERSVLSLSSDSEEDDSFVETASRSTQSISSFGRASRDTPTSPTTTSRKSVRSRGESVASGPDKKAGKRASFALTPTYLTIPSSSPTLKPTTVNPRTSSLHRGIPQQQQQSPSSRASSRISTLSASTTNSDWQAQAGFEVKEAKAVVVRPVASTAQSLASEPRSSPEGKQSARKPSMRSGDQPTPPLSPASVDFGVEPEASIDASSSQNPRLMAVTRQEQMLLAALRSKRAMMRETLMAEFEGESQQANAYGHKHTSSQATIKGPAYQEPTQTLRHQGSGTSSGTIKLDTRGSDKRRESSTTSKQDGYRHRNSGGTATRSSSRSGSLTASKASSLKKARFVRDDSPSANDDGRHERVLLYLDRPKRNVTSMDQAEPSPDLSDFMDFDGDSDEEGEEKPNEDYLYSHEGRRRTEAGRWSSSRASSQRRRTGEASRPVSSTASKTKSPLARSERASMVGDDEENSEERRIMSSAALDVPDMGRKKAARLSAVGRAGPEVGWWGDDG
ncbi:hypothetical protein ACHAQA_002983 [Verticillium albo-atrum]